MLNLQPSPRLRTPGFCFDKFKNDAFSKFIEAFTNELSKALSQIKFCSNFSILDPRKLSEDLPSLEAYGRVELDKLLEHYGNRQSNKFDGTAIN